MNGNSDRRGKRGRPRRRQRGAVLLIVLTVIILVSAAVLIDRLDSPAASGGRSVQMGEVRQQLAEARAALIGWSISHPDQPGRLPYPDRPDAGPAPGDGYDGISDCGDNGNGANLNPGLLIGLLPTRGELTPESGANCLNQVTNWRLDLGDVVPSGQPLVYAVSANLVHQGETAINPDLIDREGALANAWESRWLTVRDATGAVISRRVAAVIIAPGPPLEPGQDRDPSVDPNPPVSQYLDSVTIGAVTYRNDDFTGCPDDQEGCPAPSHAEDFIVYPNSDLTPDPNDRFNDVMVWITADELIELAGRRALAEATRSLAQLADGDGDGVPDRAYPFMSAYEDPRAVEGTASGGSATTLADTSGVDFVALGVQAGDLVVNLADGESATVSTVAPTVVTFDAPLTGAAAFDAGEAYAIRAPFVGDLGEDEGHLPMVDVEAGQTYDVDTGLTLTWSWPDVTAGLAGGTYHEPILLDGAPSVLIVEPGTAVAQLLANMGNEILAIQANVANPLVVPTPSTPPNPGEGRCSWTTPGVVDCTWSVGAKVAAGFQVDPCQSDGASPPACAFVTPNALDVDRRVTVTAQFTGTPSVTPGPGALARDVLADATPVNAFVTVRYSFDYLGDEYIVADVEIGAANGTLAALTASGIRMDPVDWDETDLTAPALDGLVIDDAYPQWLLENEWHHYLYVRVSPSHLDGGSLDCVTDLNCILLDTPATAGARSDGQAAIVLAGTELSTTAPPQDRAVGDMDDYFEGSNATAGNGRVRRQAVATTFNDQVRVVWPPCPAGVTCRP